MGLFRQHLFLAVVVLVSVLTGCDQKTSSTTETPATGSKVDRSNPAAVYCVDQGGEYILKTGQCKLPSGESVSAWEYYRHRHQS